MAKSNEGDYYEEYELEHVKNQPKHEHHGRCAKCLFWQSLKEGFPAGTPNTNSPQGDDVGQCRFNAPGVVDFEIHWPVTHDFDWCGQYKAQAGVGGLAAM